MGLPLAVRPCVFLLTSTSRQQWPELPSHLHGVDRQLRAVVADDRHHLEELGGAGRPEIQPRVFVLWIDRHRVARRMADVLIGDSVRPRRRVDVHTQIVLRKVLAGNACKKRLAKPASTRHTIPMARAADRVHGHFLAGEVGEMAGVSGNTIGQWARWGYIRASQSAGDPHVYSVEDVA